MEQFFERDFKHLYFIRLNGFGYGDESFDDIRFVEKPSMNVFHGFNPIRIQLGNTKNNLRCINQQIEKQQHFLKYSRKPHDKFTMFVEVYNKDDSFVYNYKISGAFILNLYVSVIDFKRIILTFHYNNVIYNIKDSCRVWKTPTLWERFKENFWK